jgi:hypothetical protein
MMNVKTWGKVEEPNDWTGEVHIRYMRFYSNTDRTNRTYSQVYELAGRIYWSANIYIAFRPDLSRLVYGRYAAVPGALAVAKMRASRIALDALRKAETRRHAV